MLKNKERLVAAIDRVRARPSKVLGVDDIFNLQETVRVSGDTVRLPNPSLNLKDRMLSSQSSGSSKKSRNVGLGLTPGSRDWKERTNMLLDLKAIINESPPP